MERVLIIGGDGYCGWATALHLSARGYSVAIMDNLIRRQWDRELKIDSLTPLASPNARVDEWAAVSGERIRFYNADATNYDKLCEIIREVRPGAIVHFGQQRSAPFSMISQDHALRTLINNTSGNLNLLWAINEIDPTIHLVKLGTMGEYGTPNIDIEEGFINITHNGRSDTLPFPKQPGSFYHLTKVSDSDQIYFACRVWKLRATDLNQGVVYGLDTEETAASAPLINRLDYDGVYGTVLNRFCVEAALSHPLTVYGEGGQTRAFLNIRDTVRCVELAIKSPAEKGQFRVFNQFTEIFSVLELATRVQSVAASMGLRCNIEHLSNPRTEKESHYYKALNTNLLDLGLQPMYLNDGVIAELIDAAQRYRDRVDLSQLRPEVRWNRDLAMA